MAEAARIVDRIEPAPPFTQEDADRLNATYAGVDTATMLRDLLNSGAARRVAAVSSFGTESAVLLHLIADIDPTLPILFLDTGKMFPETLEYRDNLVSLLGLTDVRTLTPDREVLEAKDETGLRWSYDPDGCCEIRKVVPLGRALLGFDASISGRKGFQSSTRTGLPVFEIDEGRLKINPLSGWKKDNIEAYFDLQGLPRHPLEAQGYPSIGCAPCTSRVMPGEDPRAGRWRGWEKVECGIHGLTKPTDDPANEPAF